MKKKYKKSIFLILFVLFVLIIICLIVPLLHDFLFDRFSVSNYEEKNGIVSDVILKNDSDSKICENIVVDNYNIFIQCGSDYKQQFKIGDRTKYYVYKSNAYHTESQMKSGSFIGKVLDYGMFGTYILIFFLINNNRTRIFNYVDEIAGNKSEKKY